MATYIERGKSVFIPFKNGKSILDSQLKPRMYKSLQNFAKAFPKHNYDIDNIEVVEYAEVKHGEWIECFEDWRRQIVGDECSVCGFQHYGTCLSDYNYCPHCGAKNATTTDGGKEE